jgi:hypothetical protein
VTRRSYDLPKEATDEVVLTKLKRKIGNNSYAINRASRSPRTPTTKPKTADNWLIAS